MVNIYGKGGHARMIASLIDDSYSFYNDDDFYKADPRFDWIIGVGDNSNRKKIALKLGNVDFINADLGLYVMEYEIGTGVVIAPGAVIQNDVSIGNHVIINTSASVDHDCVIRDFVHIAPNATLCGAVEIGEGSFIGAGSVVIPGIKIGKNCVIGAGSVVVRDIPDNSKAYGNLAKLK